jgi:hypothetical protein
MSRVNLCNLPCFRTCWPSWIQPAFVGHWRPLHPRRPPAAALLAVSTACRGPRVHLVVTRDRRPFVLSWAQLAVPCDVKRPIQCSPFCPARARRAKWLRPHTGGR